MTQELISILGIATVVLGTVGIIEIIQLVLKNKNKRLEKQIELEKKKQEILNNKILLLLEKQKQIQYDISRQSDKESNSYWRYSSKSI